MEYREFAIYRRLATEEDVKGVFIEVRKFMTKHKIGCFGLSQTGDLFGYTKDLIRWKVMNTTFYDTRYIQRGERGLQDEDTSQFVSIYNDGLFTGSPTSGLCLKQTQSAQQEGGLTELYNECKLLNKALVTVIQYPSCIFAEKQVRNGGRLHHHINKRYLIPKLLKGTKEHDNIAWDTYAEDIPFTLEPKRKENAKYKQS